MIADAIKTAPDLLKAQETARQIAVQEPLALVFDYLNRRPRGGPADALSVGPADQLGTAAEGVVILKSAMSLVQTIDLISAEKRQQ